MFKSEQWPHSEVIKVTEDKTEDTLSENIVKKKVSGWQRYLYSIFNV